MIGMKIDQAKALFFDARPVVDDMDRRERKALSKFGAFVRIRARRSIRTRKKSSPVGSPPSNHTGLLKQFILFIHDAPNHSVVIGPTLLNQKSNPPITELLEHGGTIQVKDRVMYVNQEAGRNDAGQFVSKGKKKIVISGTLTYGPRPYMGPAFAAELPKAASYWAD